MMTAFLLMCGVCFMAAWACFRAATKVQLQEEAARPDGVFVQALVQKKVYVPSKDAIQVTLDVIVGQKRLIHRAVVTLEEGRGIKLDKPLPVVYDEEQNHFWLNPGIQYQKKRTKLLAATVFLSMCGSYLALTIYPFMTWL